MAILITGQPATEAWTTEWDCTDAASLAAHDFTSTEAHTINGVDVVGRYGTTRALQFELDNSTGLVMGLGTGTGEWGWWYSSGYTTGPDQEAPRLDFLVADAISGYDADKDFVCLQWRVTDMTIESTYHNVGAFAINDISSLHANVVRGCHYHNGSSLQSRIAKSGNGYVANSSAFEMWEMLISPSGEVIVRAGAWPGDWELPMTWTASWEGRSISDQTEDAVVNSRFNTATTRMGLFLSKWSSGNACDATFGGWRLLRVPRS